MGVRPALPSRGEVVGQLRSRSAVAHRSDGVPRRRLKAKVGDPGHVSVERREDEYRTAVRACSAGEPHELFFGRGRHGRAGPCEEGGDDHRRRLSRALHTEKQHVVLRRRLQELPA